MLSHAAKGCLVLICGGLSNTLVFVLEVQGFLATAIPFKRIALGYRLNSLPSRSIKMLFRRGFLPFLFFSSIEWASALVPPTPSFLAMVVSEVRAHPSEAYDSSRVAVCTTELDSKVRPQGQKLRFDW